MAFALCLGAAYWSIRFAIADDLYRQNNPQSLRRSVALVPGNASYHALLAEHMEGLGLNPDSEFVMAARLSPLESRYWIRLGFRAEAEHEYERAEQYLLHAAAVDRKFDPRWALMNFYFRRGRMTEFWRWTERAFEMSYGDLTPIFHLAWEATDDAAEVRRHLPERMEVLQPYLAFLLANKRLQASGPLARQIAGSAASGDDMSLLLAWWEYIHEADGAAALAVWNALCERKALPFRPLNPTAGQIITNGDFSLTPMQRGYDWRLAGVDGVSALADESAKELVVRMSGKEPEELVLAEQWIPVEPGTRYAVTWEDRAPGGDAVTGLSWTVTGVMQAPEALGRSADFSTGTGWKTGRLLFVAGDNHIARLSLRYTRPLGLVRAEGTVAIRKIAGEIAK